MPDLTLTFDNGPEPSVTPKVLASLAARGIETTFFVLGRKIVEPAGRDMALAARAAGHRLANHTYTHTTPLGELGDPAALDEVMRTDALLEEMGVTEKLFRPFGGGGKLGPHLMSPGVVRFLAEKRYSCVLWNSIPRDWADPEGWVERALEQMRGQDWTLMVLHDLPTGAMDHLERFLDRAEAAGARFRSDFPPALVPIVDGQPVRPLDDCVAAAA